MIWTSVRRPLLALLLLVLSAHLASAHGSAEGRASPAYRDGELLVRFHGAQVARAASVHAALGARREGAPGGVQRVRLPPGLSVTEAQRWYALQPEVAYAEPNYRIHKTAVPNDPWFSQQWSLRNTGQTVNGVTGVAGADIGAVAAWDHHVGSGDVVVALLDTGIDLDHPDLTGNLWRNPGEIAGNGVDDDGNGFVDDLHGWNFVGNNGNVRDTDPEGHGTHVAGIIGAIGDNGLGVAGVNWRVRLMPLKILGDDGGDIAGIIAAIDYAIARGARVINASYSYACGVPPSMAEREALQRAQAADILVVAAAGNADCDNDARPTYPASHALNNLLAVGASDASDRRARFGTGASNYGAHSVHLFAPGHNVLSTARLSFGGYALLTGTSAAAPHVAGAAALLMSHRPHLDMREVREILLKSAAPRPDLAQRAVTGGRLDLARAMPLDLAAETPIQPSHLRAVRVHDQRIDLTWLDDSTIETHWQVERRETPDAEFYWIASPATSAPMTQSYQDALAPAGEGSYIGYRLRAANARGASPPSAEARVLVPPAVPDQVLARTAQGRAVITWRDNSRREDGYRVERARDGEIFSEIANLPANSTRHEDAGIAAGSVYRYRVRAHSVLAGYSEFSAVARLDEPASASGGGGGGGCFIATAAYGSALHPRVAVLRQLRDRYLLTHAPGRVLVRAYYRLSPPLAAWIARDERARAVTRALLYPLVWLAQRLVPEAEAGTFFTPARETDPIVERQLLVKLKPGIDEAATIRLLRASGATSWELRHDRLYRVEYPDRARRDRAVDALGGAPEVEYAEANRVARLPRQP